MVDVLDRLLLFGVKRGWLMSFSWGRIVFVCLIFSLKMIPSSSVSVSMFLLRTLMASCSFLKLCRGLRLTGVRASPLALIVVLLSLALGPLRLGVRQVNSLLLTLCFRRKVARGEQCFGT